MVDAWTYWSIKMEFLMVSLVPCKNYKIILSSTWWRRSWINHMRCYIKCQKTNQLLVYRDGLWEGKYFSTICSQVVYIYLLESKCSPFVQNNKNWFYLWYSLSVWDEKRGEKGSLAKSTLDLTFCEPQKLQTFNYVLQKFKRYQL